MKVFIIPFLFCLTQLITTVSGQEIIKVACVGNSITEGANIAEGERYPDKLQELLGSSHVVRNFGVGGRTLLKKGDFPYWNESRYREVLGWEPDIVVIKLGTNDSKPQNWKHKDEFERDYIALIRSFRELPSNPRIYLCLPVPVFKTAWGITEEVVLNEVIPRVRNVAEAEKLTLIDLYAPLAGKPEMAPDGVHPNAQGAAVMATAVYRYIH